MGIAKRVFALFKGRRLENDLDDEVRFHIEMRIDDYVQSGMSHEEATRAAIRQFGNRTYLKEETRRMDTINWLESLWRDICYCAYVLVRRPGFSLAALLILALGIGLNGAIFSVVNSVLLRPLPYGQPDKLVQLWETENKVGNMKSVIAPGNFLEWQTRSKTFQDMSAFNIWLPSLTGVGEPVELYGATVMPNFFSVLGVNPQMGRPFGDGDVDPKGTRVVIISNSLWHRQFGSDPEIVGRVITLNERQRTIVGVMPPSFRHPELLLQKEVEIWVPVPINPADASKGSHYMRAIARLKPDATIQQARTELTAIAQQLAEAFPDTNKNRGVNVLPLHEQITGNVRPALLILQGAVAFLLLIVCMNIAILFLSYGKAREREIAIRSALGATSGRLVRQLFTESLMLSVIGGALGVMLAFYAVRAFIAVAPKEFPRLSEVSIDKYAIGFSVLVSLLTGLIFGLAPALQVRKSALTDSLSTGKQSASTARGALQLRNILVIAEVALTLTLLTGSGLLIKSFVKLQSIDPGFNAENLLTMQISVPSARGREPKQEVEFYDEILAKVKALPGVESAGTILALPIVGLNDMSITFNLTGTTPTRNDEPQASYRTVSSDYFKTMQIPLKSGRFFTEADNTDSQKIAIINEAFAKRYLPDVNPIGKQLTYQAFGPVASFTIVGVVGDIKHAGLENDAEIEMYIPYSQGAHMGFTAMVVKTKVKPSSMASAVTGVIWGIEKNTLVSDVAPMDYVIADSIARPRFNSLVLGIFAAVALILSAVGIYGVVAYSVSQRTAEIGIRRALGAQSRDVLKLLMGNGAILSIIGIAIGLAGSLALTRVIEGLLFKMSATDPATFISIPLLLMIMVLLAIFIPAQRATRIDPMIALRHE